MLFRLASLRLNPFGGQPIHLALACPRGDIELSVEKIKPAQSLPEEYKAIRSNMLWVFQCPDVNLDDFLVTSHSFPGQRRATVRAKPAINTRRRFARPGMLIDPRCMKMGAFHGCAETKRLLARRHIKTCPQN